MFAWAATGTFHYEFVINKDLVQVKRSGIGLFNAFQYFKPQIVLRSQCTIYSIVHGDGVKYNISDVQNIMDGIWKTLFIQPLSRRYANCGGGSKP